MSKPSNAFLATVVALLCTSAVAQEDPDYFPLHVGDTWAYGKFCMYRQDGDWGPDQLEGTLTRVISHIDTVEAGAYYMTEDVYELPDGSRVSPLRGFLEVVHSNYRVDTEGNVYAYDREFGVELLLFRLNAQPGEEWAEYEGDLEGFQWIWEKLEWQTVAYGYSEGMAFIKWSVIGQACGGVALRPGIGMDLVSNGNCGVGGGSECGYQLLWAVIDGQQHMIRPVPDSAVRDVNWGRLKRSF